MMQLNGKQSEINKYNTEQPKSAQRTIMIQSPLCIDLSHQLTTTTPTYGHDAPYSLTTDSTINTQGYAHHTIQLGTHVGTHIDAPSHFIEGTPSIDQFPAEYFVKRGIVIDARGAKLIDQSFVSNAQLKADDIVLFYTGHTALWGTQDYFAKHPQLTEDCVDLLIAKKINMIGIDAPSIDTHPFDLHKKVLRKNILIIENLTNLHMLLPLSSCLISALPLALNKASASPARVVALYEQGYQP